MCYAARGGFAYALSNGSLPAAAELVRWTRVAEPHLDFDDAVVPVRRRCCASDPWRATSSVRSKFRSSEAYTAGSPPQESRKLLRCQWTSVAGLTSTMALRAFGQNSVKPRPEEPVGGEEPKLTRALPPKDIHLMSQGDELKLN